MKPSTTFLALTLVLAACGSGEPGTMPSDVQPDDVILQVVEEGGFAPVELILGRHPRYVLQADGRLYAPGPVPAIYPGPMVTPIMVGSVDEPTMQRILDLIATAGLPDVDRLEDTTAADRVADATTTVVTFFDGVTEHVISVYAVGIAAEQSETADRVQALVEGLQEAASEISMVEYEPTKVEIRTGDRMALPDPEFRNSREWPLAIAPDEMPETDHGWRCVVVEGPPARDLLDLFSTANGATTWVYEGTEHPLVTRGLMPGEPGCA